ncbi:MAG: hypothetical protein LBC61_05345 [Candidatus Peribacteria bacterium]|nr:hypothetical protein [Candidatus Peribacteria bacterium]
MLSIEYSFEVVALANLAHKIIKLLENHNTLFLETTANFISQAFGFGSDSS